MSEVRGKQWVVKSNDYIEAKFSNYKPTLVQNRVVLWLAARVHSQKDSEFSLVECTTNELRSVMGKRYTNEELVYELGILRSATAIMKQGSVWKAFGIIDIAELDEESNLIKLKLNDTMKPFLLNLGEGGNGFTSIELDKVQSMRSVNSQRLYELLVQYRNLGRGDARLMKLQTLKEHLGLYEKKKGGKIVEKFPRWSDFEVRVLRQAEKDLCNAGMFIHYEPIKTGRKVTSLKFTFSIQKNHNGELLRPFMKLQLTGLTDYEKIQIANTNTLESIEKAIIEADSSNSLKPLKKLIPKTRKEYNEKLSSMIEGSLQPSSSDPNLQFDL